MLKDILNNQPHVGLIYSHAEGYMTIANGAAAHAEGFNTLASGSQAHAEGAYTVASGDYTHAEGNLASAFGEAARAAGTHSLASGAGSVAEGWYNSAYNYAHAEGGYSIASGDFSHAEGYYGNAVGDASHVEGYYTSAIKTYTHSEGSYTIASGTNSHSEGYQTSAIGDYSHAEGINTKANGTYAHAEGNETISNDIASHAEGQQTSAMGSYSHVEGNKTLANANYAHAEGRETSALYECSHAEGYGTIANSNSMHVGGKFNKTSADALFVIGNGTGVNARNDAFIVSGNGTISATNIMTSGINVASYISQLESTVTSLSNLINSYSGRWVLTPETPEIPTVTIGGKTYRTVTIGNQEWMAENLDLSGDWLGKLSGNSLVSPQGSYNNWDEANSKYGILYNWAAVTYMNDNSASIDIPEGWGIPTKADLQTLVTYVGSGENPEHPDYVAGKYLKTAAEWNYNPSDPRQEIDETFGFSATPAGQYVGYSTNFYAPGGYVGYWSKTQSTDSQNNAYFLPISINGREATINDYSKDRGYSVRLVRNIT